MGLIPTLLMSACKFISYTFQDQNFNLPPLCHRTLPTVVTTGDTTVDPQTRLHNILLSVTMYLVTLLIL